MNNIIYHFFNDKCIGHEFKVVELFWYTTNVPLFIRHHKEDHLYSLDNGVVTVHM